MQNFFLTTILILSTLVQLNTGLKVGFGDDDRKTTEDRGSLEMRVSASEVRSTATVEVIPMTVEEYITETGHDGIITDIGEGYDPAEADLDFNSTVNTIYIDSNGEYKFSVDIINDAISEFEEVFVLYLRQVLEEDGLEKTVVEITQSWSIIRIRVDSEDSALANIHLVVVNSTLHEQDGLVPNAVYIEIEGSVEPAVTVQLSAVPEEDIHLVQTEIEILSNETRAPVPIEVVTNSIAEYPQSESLSMVIPKKYLPLFSIDNTYSGSIYVQDDDVPVVGFKERSSYALFEGETTEICVLLSEPDFVERILSFEVIYTTESNLSFSGPRDFGFYSKPYEYCLNVTFADNDVINYPTEAVFSLTYHDQGFFEDLLDPVFQPGNITITIKDDDGVPKPPTDIETHYFNDKKDVLLTWKSDITELQLIDQYVIESSSELFSVSTIERRQTDKVEYVTQWTHFYIGGLDQLSQVTVYICAENSLGRICAEPKDLVYVEPTVSVNTVGAIKSNKTGIELKYLIPIIVLPILLAVICLILLLVAIVACCMCAKSRSKHYYPARQEQRMESTRQSFAEGRCVNQPAIIVTYKMRETPSSESVEWIGKPSSEENGSMWNQIKQDLELKSEDLVTSTDNN